jgi:uncharacterized membrane protein (DUF485 family)
MRSNQRDLHSLSPEEHARLAQHVMHEQAGLSLKVAVVFVILVFGLPLFNNFLPDLANTRILGFTATWLFLGVLFFPITWALSAYFIRESNRIESECSDWRSFLGLTAEGVDEIQPAFVEENEEGGRA